MAVKKVFIGIGLIIVLVLIALVVAPVIFKDEIKTTIDDQLEANINAEVIYDIDNFSVSVFSNFPNLTAGISEIGVIGRDKFAGEILFAVQNFEVEVNIWKLLSGETSVKGIYMDSPQIFITVLEDGSANYDIVKDTGEEVESDDTEVSNFTVAIEQWAITNGHIIYDDATLPTYLELTNFNHSGSGEFSLSVFDLKTKTDAYVNRISYDGMDYLNDRSVSMDFILNMNLDEMKFSFKENTIAINDFAFGIDGWVAMPSDDIDMDLEISSKDNSFKSLISLIPAIYLEDFTELESSGEMNFNGRIVGVYNETSLPSYNLNLNVKDGMFHYPSLPESVQNVQLAMNITSADGNVDNTSIDISAFHIDFGKEPFDGHLKIDNLINYPIDLAIRTRLDLNNLSKLYPIAELSMAGILEADIKAKGVYDSIKNTIPKIDSKISLSNGNISYTDLGAPISEINFNMNIVNSTAKLNDTKVLMPDFKFKIDEQPVMGSFLIENLDDPNWMAQLNGTLDFNKLYPTINKLYPLPGTTLSGIIMAEFQSEGRMSDVDNERYDKLSTSGMLTFNNFGYSDSLYLPQGLKISKGTFSFTPKAIKAKELTLLVGQSDFSVDGEISNYLNYVLADDVLKGSMQMISHNIDVNEFMTSEETEGDEAESEAYSVIEIPKNIDFIFTAKMDQIAYDNLILKDAAGKILIKNGVLNLNDLKTSTLGGGIVFNGMYSALDIEKPQFNMKLDVQQINIDEAYTAFNTVKLFAPVAKNVKGKVSTLFSLNGFLQEDMMPNMSTLNGEGRLKINKAELSDSKIVAGLTQYLKGMESNSLDLTDVSMYVKISNGKISVSPFDIKLKNSLANIAGSTSLDGSLDYQMKLEVPAGQLGSQVNSLLGSVSGTANASDIIKLNLGMGGTYSDPQIKLLGTDTGGMAKKTAVTQLSKITGTDSQLADSIVNTNIDSLVDVQKKMAEAELQKQQDSLKKAAELEVEKAKQKALDEANKQLKSIFGPKKKKN